MAAITSSSLALGTFGSVADVAAESLAETVFSMPVLVVVRLGSFENSLSIYGF